MRKIAAPIALAVTLVLGLQGVAEAALRLAHTAVSISVTPTQVPPGSSVTITGTLTAQQNRFRCYARRRIGLFQNHHFVETDITDNTGVYTFTVPVQTTSVFFVRFKGATFFHHPNRVICLASRSQLVLVTVESPPPPLGLVGTRRR